MKRRSRVSLVTVKRKTMPSIYLFKSGIEELDELLNQEEPTSLTFSDDEYQYESLNELFEQYGKKEIRSLDILALYPDSVLVTVARRGVVMHSSHTTPKTLAVFMRLEQFFKVHRRRSLGVLLNPVFFPAAMLALAILIVVSGPTNNVNQLLAMSLVLLMVCLLVWDRRGKFSRIQSINSYEQDSFWLRNKDQLVIAFLGLLVGAILSFVGTYILVKTGLILR